MSCVILLRSYLYYTTNKSNLKKTGSGMVNCFSRSLKLRSTERENRTCNLQLYYVLYMNTNMPHCSLMTSGNVFKSRYFESGYAINKNIFSFVSGFLIFWRYPGQNVEMGKAKDGLKMTYNTLYSFIIIILKDKLS